MTDDELKQLIGFNAKAIKALTSSFNDFKAQAELDRKQWQGERTAFYDTLTQMQRQFLDLGRQFLDLQRQNQDIQRQNQDIQRRIEDKNADIRELVIENQRILRYLENIVNRSEPPQ